MEAFAWRWIFSLLSCHDFKFCQRDTQTHNLQLSRSEFVVKFHVEIQSYSATATVDLIPTAQNFTQPPWSSCRKRRACELLDTSTLAKRLEMFKRRGGWSGANANIAEVPRRSVRSVLCGSVRCVSRSSCEIKWGEAMNGVWVWNLEDSSPSVMANSNSAKPWIHLTSFKDIHKLTSTYTHIHICRLCWKVNKNISRWNVTESKATMRVPTGGWTNTWCHMNEWNQWVICFETNCWYPCSRISITEANNNITSNYNISTSTRRIESLPVLRPLLKSMCLTEQWKKIAHAHGHTASCKEIGENSKVRNSKSGKMLRQPWGHHFFSTALAPGRTALAKSTMLWKSDMKPLQTSVVWQRRMAWQTNCGTPSLALWREWVDRLTPVDLSGNNFPTKVSLVSFFSGSEQSTISARRDFFRKGKKRKERLPEDFGSFRVLTCLTFLYFPLAALRVLRPRWKLSCGQQKTCSCGKQDNAALWNFEIYKHETIHVNSTYSIAKTEVS